MASRKVCRLACQTLWYYQRLASSKEGDEYWRSISASGRVTQNGGEMARMNGQAAGASKRRNDIGSSEIKRQYSAKKMKAALEIGVVKRALRRKSA